MTIIFVAVSALVFAGTAVATFMFCTWLATPDDEADTSEQHEDNHGVPAHCGAGGNADAQQVGAPSSTDSKPEPTK